MRPIALSACVALLALTTAAAQVPRADQITVEQLEQRIAALHGRGDKDIAHTLQAVELTQRLTTARLTSLQAQLPGSASRTALLSVADSSAFLDLPPPRTSPPTRPPAWPRRRASQEAFSRTPSGPLR